MTPTTIVLCSAWAMVCAGRLSLDSGALESQETGLDGRCGAFNARDHRLEGRAEARPSEMQIFEVRSMLQGNAWPQSSFRGFASPQSFVFGDKSFLVDGEFSDERSLVAYIPVAVARGTLVLLRKRLKLETRETHPCGNDRATSFSDSKRQAANGKSIRGGAPFQVYVGATRDRFDGKPIREPQAVFNRNFERALS